ncbi:hypothetical protein T02_9027 [Trichinella nativa]|uniref:Uncharacterized protein n=1 Tax=Trichinella nativa TaxID=6335 RepID=A0A0V1LDE2_9BILA|nr:hypothetical protein T02_9027 [Trichinella nativa]
MTHRFLYIVTLHPLENWELAGCRRLSECGCLVPSIASFLLSKPVHQDNQRDQPPDPQMAVSAKPHNVTVEPVKTRIPHHSEHP